MSNSPYSTAMPLGAWYALYKIAQIKNKIKKILKDASHTKRGTRCESWPRHPVNYGKSPCAVTQPLSVVKCSYVIVQGLHYVKLPKKCVFCGLNVDSPTR